MNCCDRPDIWTNNGRWPAVDGLVFGVCVRCSQIVIASELRRRYTPLVGRSLLTLHRSPRTRWIYDELTLEQRCIRQNLMHVITRPDAQFEIAADVFEATEGT